MCFLIRKSGERDESILTFTNWQSGVCVWAILCDETGKDGRASLNKYGLDRVLKVSDEIRAQGRIKVVDRGCNESILYYAAACWRTVRRLEGKSACPGREA